MTQQLLFNIVHKDSAIIYSYKIAALSIIMFVITILLYKIAIKLKNEYNKKNQNKINIRNRYIFFIMFIPLCIATLIYSFNNVTPKPQHIVYENNNALHYNYVSLKDFNKKLEKNHLRLSQPTKDTKISKTIFYNVTNSKTKTSFSNCTPIFTQINNSTVRLDNINCETVIINPDGSVVNKHIPMANPITKD